MLEILAFLPFFTSQASAFSAQSARAVPVIEESGEINYFNKTELSSTLDSLTSLTLMEIYGESAFGTIQNNIKYENSNPFIKRDETDVLLNVPYLNQKEDLKNTPDEWAGGSACGPTAIAMGLQYNNEDVSLYEVVNKLPNHVYVKGRMFYNLKAGPAYFGYQSHEIEINTEQIFNTVSAGYPVLMNIQNYDGITGHEIVVVGVKNYNPQTKTAEALVVHDPFTSAYREFTYINERTLQQPEAGWILPIGIIKPFFITNTNDTIKA